MLICFCILQELFGFRKLGTTRLTFFVKSVWQTVVEIFCAVFQTSEMFPSMIRNEVTSSSRSIVLTLERLTNFVNLGLYQATNMLYLRLSFCISFLSSYGSA